MLRVILSVSAVVIGATASGLPVGHYYGEGEEKSSIIDLKVKNKNTADFSWVFKFMSWDEHFDCKDVSYTMVGSTIAISLAENPCIVDINSKFTGFFDIGEALTMQFDSKTGSIHLVTGLMDCIDVMLNYVRPLTIVADEEDVVVPKKLTKKEKKAVKKEKKKAEEKKPVEEKPVEEETPVEEAPVEEEPKKKAAKKEKAAKVKEAAAEKPIEVKEAEAAAPVAPIVAQQEAVNTTSTTTTKGARSGLISGLAGLAVVAMMM
jgi:hypothetical protein